MAHIHSSLRRRTPLGFWFGILLLAGLSHGAHASLPLFRHPPNLVLISIDTLRADRLGCYGYAKAETPNIDRLAASGTLFEDAESAAPITLPSHSTLMTGLYPCHHGVRDNGVYRLPDRCETLAEILSEAGFQTGGIIGAVPIASQYGIAQGFQFYDEKLMESHQIQRSVDPKRQVFLPTTPSDRPASIVTRQALKWASGVSPGKPFFLFVHYYDPHRPLEAPEPFASRIKDPYDAEIAYTDAEIGKLFKGLDERSLMHHTVVAIVSDHGESLGENGELTHGLLLHSATLHVPWIVSGPGCRGGTRVQDLVRLADVPCTLLDLLGMRPFSDPVDGRSLKRSLLGKKGGIEEVSSYAETFIGYLNRNWFPIRSIRKGTLRYVDAGTPELFDVSLDPQERQNLAGDQPDSIASLSALLAELPLEQSQESIASPDAQALEGLAALGYLSSSRPPSQIRRTGPNPRDRMEAHRKYSEAIMTMASSRFDEAKALISESLLLGPDDPETYTLAASCAYSNDEQGPAETFARQALELNDRSTQAYRLLDGILQAQGRWQEAYDLCRTATEASGGEPYFLFSMARSLMALGRQEEAMAVASEAAEFVQDRIYYLVEYGTFLLEADKIQDALRVFASCLALNPHSVQALYHMGFSLMKEGRIQEADTFFQKALRLDPKSIEAHNNAASCRIQSMDFSRALWHYDAILKIDPQFLPARIGRACVLFEKGDASEGIALLEALVLEHPENPKILFNLSLCRERAGQIPLAIEGYRAVLKLSPSGSGEAKQALDALKALASQGDLPTG